MGAGSMVRIGESFGAGTGQDDWDGVDEDFEIEPEIPVVDVFEIEADPFGEIGEVGATGDLPEAGEAGFD